jgi:SHS family lactate transporter-like MFS transporter
MGGEWGVGAALAFETLPAKGRGFFSGILQEGYVVGNLTSAAIYGLLFSHLHGTGMWTGWRVMFMIGTLPALLAFYVRSHVPESPVWLASREHKLKNPTLTFDWKKLIKFLPTFLFLTLFMTAMNSMSHGTQDLYPTFLEKDKGFSSGTVGFVLVITNLGALFGGILCGSISERFGRKKTIAFAALLTLPMIPLWAWASGPIMMAVGGFLMQMMVQGAWGVIPAHLNELSPGPVRAIFPGLAYQLGNLLSSRNGVFQASLALKFAGGSLGPILSGTVVVVGLLVAFVASIGKEAKGVTLSATD